MVKKWLDHPTPTSWKVMELKADGIFGEAQFSSYLHVVRFVPIVRDTDATIASRSYSTQPDDNKHRLVPQSH